MKRLCLLFLLLLMWLSAIPASAQRLTLSGIYGVPAGGTGAASLTSHAVLLGNGTSAIQAIACTGTTSIYQGGSPGSCTATPTVGTSVTVPTLYGGAAANDDITIEGTSHGTKTTSYVILQPTGGGVSMGTAGPLATIHMRNGGTAIIASGSDIADDLLIEGPFRATNNRAHLNIVSNDALAIDKGGTINFGGKYITASNSWAGFGGIAGLKENATTENVAGYLALYSRPDGLALAERVRITSVGNVGIATSAFGTNAAGVLGLGAATAPTTSPVDVVQLWAADIAGGGTFGLNIRGELNDLYSIGNKRILAPGFATGGTTFTISGCTADTPVGGATAGTFISRTTGACTVTITMNGATGLTAPTGWACHADNQTSTANLLSQSASTTTTCTVTGTTVTGDTIVFSAMAF